MMPSVDRLRNLKKKLPKVAMKILDAALDEEIDDDSTLRLKRFGIWVSLRSEGWFHDYEGRDYISYHLTVLRGCKIVLRVRIDEPNNRRRHRYIAEIDKYIPGGWEWRVFRAA